MTEQDAAKHVNTGELQQTGSEFVCTICSSPLGLQPMPHIRGAAHRNAAFLQALTHPSHYGALYNALPSAVREAHSKGVITVKDAKYECGPCNVMLTGERPLTDHLSSSKHLGKTAGQVVPQQAPLPAAAGAFGQPLVGPASLIHPVVEYAVKDGQITASGTEFKCNLCPDTKVITGVEPMRQHLEGRFHKKYLQERQLQWAGQRGGAGTPRH